MKPTTQPLLQLGEHVFRTEAIVRMRPADGHPWVLCGGSETYIRLPLSDCLRKWRDALGVSPHSDGAYR